MQWPCRFQVFGIQRSVSLFLVPVLCRWRKERLSPAEISPTAPPALSSLIQVLLLYSSHWSCVSGPHCLTTGPRRHCCKKQPIRFRCHAASDAVRLIIADLTELIEYNEHRNQELHSSEHHQTGLLENPREYVENEFL